MERVAWPGGIRTNLAWMMYRRGILTVKEMARRADTSPRSIRALRRNEAAAISFDLLLRLCAVLECQPGDLLVYDQHYDGGHGAQRHAEGKGGDGI
jgi:putative transcriptional regulator